MFTNTGKKKSSETTTHFSKPVFDAEFISLFNFFFQSHQLFESWVILLQFICMYFFLTVGTISIFSGRSQIAAQNGISVYQRLSATTVSLEMHSIWFFLCLLSLYSISSSPSCSHSRNSGSNILLAGCSDGNASLVYHSPSQDFQERTPGVSAGSLFPITCNSPVSSRN